MFSLLTVLEEVMQLQFWSTQELLWSLLSMELLASAIMYDMHASACI